MGRINMRNRVGRALPTSTPGIAVAAMAVAAVPAALAVNALVRHAVAKHAPPFTLSAQPAARTITAGEVARYRILIRRNHFGGSVTLSDEGSLPRDAHASFAPRVTRGSRSEVSIATGAETPSGEYRVRLRAAGGGNSETFSVFLSIPGPVTLPFAIGGSVGDLYPGSPGPVDLSLANPTRSTLLISALSVGIQRIHAPNATAARPCTSADFSVQQFSGPYPLVIPGRSTRTLGQLDIASPQWPQVTVINRSANQDGCQGASLTLTYTGRGTFL